MYFLSLAWCGGLGDTGRVRRSRVSWDCWRLRSRAYVSPNVTQRWASHAQQNPQIPGAAPYARRIYAIMLIFSRTFPIQQIIHISRIFGIPLHFYVWVIRVLPIALCINDKPIIMEGRYHINFHLLNSFLFLLWRLQGYATYAYMPHIKKTLKACTFITSRL